MRYGFDYFRIFSGRRNKAEFYPVHLLRCRKGKYGCPAMDIKKKGHQTRSDALSTEQESKPINRPS